MAIPTDLLPQTATHQRPSNTLVAIASFPFTQALTRSDTTPILVLMAGAGLSGDATITIQGTGPAGPQSESVILSASGPRVARSTKLWTSITQIASASSVSGTVNCTAVTKGSAPAYQYSQVGTIRGRLRLDAVPRLVEVPQGMVKQERFVFYTNSLSVRPYDRLVVDGTTYEVVSAPIVYNGSAPHHTALQLRTI